MIIDQIQDIALQYVPIFKETDPAKQVRFQSNSFLIIKFYYLIQDLLNQEFFKTELPILLSYLENLLKSNKDNEPYFLGKSVSKKK